MNAYRCDNCGEFFEEREWYAHDFPTGKFTLEYYWGRMSHDFCSWECVRDFAGAKAGQE